MDKKFKPHKPDSPRESSIPAAMADEDPFVTDEDSSSHLGGSHAHADTRGHGHGREYSSDESESLIEPFRYVFYPTWRSQLISLVGYFLLCALAVWGTHQVPVTLIKGKLFAIGDAVYYLYLPVLVLLPGFLLGRILIYIYNCKYIIDDGGVEAQVGLVSMRLSQPRLRWEDIRGVIPDQTLWERFLGVGKVGIGSAMTDTIEIGMVGVANPRAIQILVCKERDRRLSFLRRGPEDKRNLFASD